MSGATTRPDQLPHSPQSDADSHPHATAIEKRDCSITCGTADPTPAESLPVHTTTGRAASAMSCADG
ncbi:MAG: hypothetical protein AB7I38_07145 [Dehalococcoidia bacterium]